jgi:hypothetical protein
MSTPFNEYYSGRMENCVLQSQSSTSMAIPNRKEFQLSKGINYMSSGNFMTRFELNTEHDDIQNVSDKFVMTIAV